MKFFHDEESGPLEPQRGMPEPLPEGETVLWQGQPDWVGLMVGAFRLRWIIAWFIGMTGWRLISGVATGTPADGLIGMAAVSAVFLVAAVLVVSLLAYGMSRAAIFTITTKRVVLRHGFAIRKYVNVPFARMESAKLKPHGSRVGDIAIQLSEPNKIGYLHLWPFARPFRYLNTQPMLRALKDADGVARLLADAVARYAPEATQIELAAEPRKPAAEARSDARRRPSIDTPQTA